MKAQTDILRECWRGYEPKALDESNYLHAAVLVPLVEVAGETHLVFEVRSHDLRRQPGEISFPGGRCEDDDADSAATALRECSEELGVAETDIEYIGPLDYLVSPIGVRLHSHVGYLRHTNFHSNPAEVAEIFTVPLEFLLKVTPHKAIMQVATKPKENFPYERLPNYNPDWRMRQTYPVYFYEYQGYQIWGLTARVLKNFLAIYRKIM